MNRCRHCREAVIWINLPSGKRMPVDPVPDPDGNVVVDARRSSNHRTGRVDKDAPGPKHMPHFATCPELKRRDTTTTKGTA